MGCPGRLEVGIRVMLCFTYHFAMLRFWTGILYFGEIGDPGDRLLRFLNSLGVGGLAA